MKKRSEILNAGLSISGAGSGKTVDQITFEAIDNALKNAPVDFHDIDCFIFCENKDTGIINPGGSNLFNRIARREEFNSKSIYKIFQDGLYGLYIADLMLASKQYDIVMVIASGNPSSGKDFSAGSISGSVINKFNPISMAGLEMRKYLALSGDDRDNCAEIVAESKRKAGDNVRANFGGEISKDQVLNSEIISEPLSVMDVSPSVDASAALIVSSPDIIKSPEKVFIDSICWVLDKGAGNAFFSGTDIGYPAHLENVSGQIYDKARISKVMEEIDLFELEDSYSFQLLQAVKAMKLSLNKSAFDTFMENNNRINISGGSLGMGNPLSARGLLRVAEAVLQLKGAAGPNQAELSKFKILVQVHEPLPRRSGGGVILSRE
ncbi:MAG: thiolase family protein [Armatimonadota bacterium]